MKYNAERLMALVEKHKDLIITAQQHIFDHPEVGFQEWETSKYLSEQFRKLGYTPVEAGDIPGFYADLDTGIPGPKIAVFGEMDALIVPGHPKAKNGIVHACGHNAQCAILLGIAAAMKEPGAIDGLCGSIRFIAVPAEELIQVDYRRGLVQKGVIHSLHGKGEFLYRGFLDGVDAAFLFHASVAAEGNDFYYRDGSNGMSSKVIEYHGVSAHAGGAPHKGVNAMYAATLGLQAINSLRETFRDQDQVRVHPILTLGDCSVNTIPHYARIETYVRGKTLSSIQENSRKVNRALAGAALSMGTGMDIYETGAYAPLLSDPRMGEIACRCMETVSPGKVLIRHIIGGGCTDMGDVSTIMPTVHPYACGVTGTAHGDNYYISDPIKACVNPAKAGVLMLHELLGENAAEAKSIIADYKPLYASPAEYCNAMKETMKHLSFSVTTDQDGAIQAKLN